MKFEDLAKAERRLPRIEAELETAEVRPLFPELLYKTTRFLSVSLSSDLLPKKSSVTRKNTPSSGTLIISTLSVMNFRRKYESIKISSTTLEWVSSHLVASSTVPDGLFLGRPSCDEY